MRAAVWNIRGIGSSHKKRMIKSLIKEESIGIIGLVESKHREITVQDMNSCWGNFDVGWLQVPAEEGAAGGLILTWLKDAFILEDHTSSQHWILASGVMQLNMQRCNICIVYAPSDQRGRLEVWNQLRELKSARSQPWILMGDFNEVINHQERRGASITTQGMKELAQCIQDLSLIDLDINLKYTWMRSNAASRIDRALVDVELIQSFPGLRAYCKGRSFSDHHPIILAFSNVQWGPTPFRSLDCWLKDPGFIKVFQHEWIQLAGLSLDQKLKKIKAPLKKWNREVFGHIDNKIQAFQKELGRLDMVAQTRSLQETEWSRRMAVQSQLWLWLTRKERYWKQMSRCKLLKEGDRNTKYFHTLATIRRRKNMISTIQKDGEVLTEPNQVRKALIQHFKSLYAWQEAPHYELDSLDLNKLTPEMAAKLEEPVTVEEIKDALSSCDSSKAPGYDGFNIKCIKHVWPVIGNEVSAFILHFFETGYLPPSINVTWVTLIPKKKVATEIRDYRPISMVGSIYKLTAKILSKRLREALPALIGEAQTAFIKGRQILDGALIANETVQWLKRKKKPGILMKLDFEKAYDTLSWDSVDNVLREMGFGVKWRRWIEACITTPRVSILFNGNPCKPFKMGRGVRQGDPLSPFLFVLVAEVLNKLLMKAESIGLFRGLKVGRRGEIVTHLQFADDTLLFCEANEEYLRNIKNILLCFQEFSGLAVNYSKSGLLVLGKDETWANQVADQLGCQLIKLPFTYLGVPLGANMRKISSWQTVVDKIQDRLNCWKGTCISRAGRLVLIKAVLQSLPIYYLSLFKMPSQVAQEIIKIQRRFLWSGKQQGKYQALVKWELIQKPKNKGGLGVKDCILHNAALLFKWWWRYACEEGALWKRIVDSIHEDTVSIMPSKTKSAVPGPWSMIKRIAREENVVSKAFFQVLGSMWEKAQK